MSAEPNPGVAIGLKAPGAKEKLRSTIADGSIGDQVSWHTAVPGDVFDVSAGTIHGIESGLVIAEIQQNSGATVRSLDIGHQRELNVEEGLRSS